METINKQTEKEEELIGLHVYNTYLKHAIDDELYLSIRKRNNVDNDSNNTDSVLDNFE